jgi:hypothetical protein
LESCRQVFSQLLRQIRHLVKARRTILEQPLANLRSAKAGLAYVLQPSLKLIVALIE